MNIFLIGMMGSGKSTVGELLANKKGLNFVDIDLQVELKEKKSVNEVFEKRGEGIFRKIESSELIKCRNSVVSCGGGILLKTKNREFINKNGVTILLLASIDQLSNRLTNLKNRPLIQKDGISDMLSKIWQDRKKDYLNSSDIKIKTDDKRPMQIMEEIDKRLPRWK